jgi:hypothetical protein
MCEDFYEYLSKTITVSPSTIPIEITGSILFVSGSETNSRSTDIELSASEYPVEYILS